MPLDLNAIVECFRVGRYFITTHGYEELDNDNITIEILEKAIGDDSPVIIEDYPQDRRGASCLISGWFEPNQSIHVVVGVTGDEPVVITAYKPNFRVFYPPDYRRRR
jgi:hypothetical protein